MQPPVGHSKSPESYGICEWCRSVEVVPGLLEVVPGLQHRVNCVRSQWYGAVRTMGMTESVDENGTRQVELGRL